MRTSPSSSIARDFPLLVVPAWIEAHCRVPDGFRAGEPVALYRYQRQWFVNVYLVRGDIEQDLRAPILGTAFVSRYALMVGPQGIGKNPMIAMQVCVEAVGPALFAGRAGPDEGWVCRDHGCPCGWEYPYEPGEPMGMAWPTPLIQITAFSEDSTGNTYDALRPMISEGPLADVMPRAGEEFIRLPGGGRIDTVTSSHRSRLGARSTFVPQDELQLWTPEAKMVPLFDTQLRNVSKMGGRGAGTTNMWDPNIVSVAKREWESGSPDVYRQMIPAPAGLSYADRRDRRRIHRAVYAEVLREHGGHVELESIERQAADLIAKGDLPQAARYYGNLAESSVGTAVPAAAWDALARPKGPDGTWPDGLPPAGTAIGLGFDGSIYRDVTSLRGCTGDGYRFTVGTWSPPRGEALRRWEAAHPGERWAIPRDEVNSAVLWCLFTYKVVRFRPDPPKWWEEIDEWAEWFGQSFDKKPVVIALDTNQPLRIAPAFDRWMVAVAEGSALHDGDPVTTQHVHNLHRKPWKSEDGEDDRTMFVPVKGPDKLPIDCAIADILAGEAASVIQPTKPKPALFVGRV